MWYESKIVRLAIGREFVPYGENGGCTVEGSLMPSDTERVSPHSIFSEVALVQLCETSDTRGGYCVAVDIFVDHDPGQGSLKLLAGNYWRWKATGLYCCHLSNLGEMPLSVRETEGPWPYLWLFHQTLSCMQLTGHKTSSRVSLTVDQRGCFPCYASDW